MPPIFFVSAKKAPLQKAMELYRFLQRPNG
jgi:hypothetical protein